MMRINRTLVLAGVTLATVALAAQDGTVLRRTLKDNTTETYKVESKAKQSMDVPGQGPMDTNITSVSTYVLKTGKVDANKGTAEFTVTHTVDSLDADGPAGDAMKNNMPKPVTTTGTINGRGEVEMAPAKLSGAQAMNAAEDAAGIPAIMIFPDKGVKIGDTWDIPVKKGPLTYSEDQKLTAKLTGETKLGDKDAWVIATTGTLKLDIDTSKFPDDPDATGPMANAKFHITGTAEMTGETTVDKATGKTLKSEVKSKMTQKIEITSMGISLDATSTSTTTVTPKE